MLYSNRYQITEYRIKILDFFKGIENNNDERFFSFN